MPVADDSGPAPRLAFGVVSTTLLESSWPVRADEARQLLDLVPGRVVSWTTHPVSRGVSPDIIVGADCKLPVGHDGGARGVGTVVTHAALTGGHVLQGTAYAQIRLGGPTRRMRWSHYSSQPGIIEILKTVRPEDLVAGWEADRAEPELLALGAASLSVLGRVRQRPILERSAALRCQTARFRWALRIDAECPPEMKVFQSADSSLRALIVAPPNNVAEAVRFAEVFALHDWLKRTIEGVLDRSQRDPARLRELASARIHLPQLWNPAAHLAPGMQELWVEFDRCVQFGWQWETLVQRVRDRLDSAVRR